MNPHASNVPAVCATNRETQREEPLKDTFETQERRYVSSLESKRST